RNRRQAQRRRQSGAGESQGDGALPRPRRRSNADEPGRVRQARRRRDREMGQGGEVGGFKGGVTLGFADPHQASFARRPPPFSGGGFSQVPVNTGLRFSINAARPSL